MAARCVVFVSSAHVDTGSRAMPALLSFEYADARRLERVFASVADVVSSGNVHVSAEEGLTLSVFDPSHISLVCLAIPRAAFAHFECVRPQTLGLVFQTMQRVLHWCPADCSVRMYVEQDNADLLCVDFVVTGSDTCMNRFTIALLSEESELHDVAGAGSAYDACVHMEPRAFDAVVRKMCEFGDDLVMSATNQGEAPQMVLQTVSDAATMTRAEQVLRADPTMALEVKRPVRVTFALRLLRVFSKAHAVATDAVIMYLSENAPLKLVYPFGTGESMSFYLAPKCSDGDA